MPGTSLFHEQKQSLCSEWQRLMSEKVGSTEDKEGSRLWDTFHREVDLFLPLKLTVVTINIHSYLGSRLLDSWWLLLWFLCGPKLVQKMAWRTFCLIALSLRIRENPRRGCRKVVRARIPQISFETISPRNGCINNVRTTMAISKDLLMEKGGISTQTSTTGN